MTLEIIEWDQLAVNFYPPDDDGGSSIDSYLVEWWTTGTYGMTEIQVIKILKTNTDGTFTLQLDTDMITGPISVNAYALYSDVEAALEALDHAGDITVTTTASTGIMTIYTITFNTRVGIIPIWMDSPRYLTYQL